MSNRHLIRTVVEPESESFIWWLAWVMAGTAAMCGAAAACAMWVGGW